MFQLNRALMGWRVSCRSFTAGLFVCLACLYLNCHFIVNKNYLSSLLCCQTPASNPPSHLIRSLLSHHALPIFLPSFLSTHPAITPRSNVVELGLTSTLLLCIAVGPNCWSFTQTYWAALSLAGHTTLQQTAQQQQRQLQLPQFNTPSHPSASTTTTLKGSN